MELLKVNLASEHERWSQVGQSVDNGGSGEDPGVKTIKRENGLCRLSLAVSDLVRLIDSDAEPLGPEKRALLVWDLILTLVVASLLPATVARLLALVLRLEARLGTESSEGRKNDVKLFQRGCRLCAACPMMNANLPLLAGSMALNFRLPSARQLNFIGWTH